MEINVPIAPGAAFERLSERARHRLLNFDKNVIKNQSHLLKAFNDPAIIMQRACVQGDIEIVSNLLDMGFSADCVECLSENLHAAPLSQIVVPLSVASLNYKRLPLVDFLLDRGANPNRVSPGDRFTGGISPMHAACIAPDTMRKLIARGGDVSIRLEDGWGVLDHWLWRMSGIDPIGANRGMETLGILLENNISLDTFSGKSFLVECWRLTFLRNRIRTLFQLGLDPHARGSAVGIKGASLVEHLNHKVQSGKSGKLAAEIVALFNAQYLDTHTPSVSAARRAHRL